MFFPANVRTQKSLYQSAVSLGLLTSGYKTVIIVTEMDKG